MQVWIYGVGGVGSVVAGRLAATVAGLVLIDGWREHAQALRTRGLAVAYPDGVVRTGPLDAWDEDAVDRIGRPPDVVLLCVKAYDTAAAMQRLLPLMHPESVVVSLQNAVNIDTIAALAGAGRTIGASVLFDGELLGPGTARQMRLKPIVIGEAAGPATARTHRIAGLLAPVAPVEVSGRIRDVLWSKLVSNTGNCVAATSGLGLGRLVERDDLLDLWIGLAAEAIRVAQAAGIAVIPDHLYGGGPEAYLVPRDSAEGRQLRAAMRRLFAPYPDLKATMLQDLEKGRRTEVSELNGYVAATGKSLGIDTPLNGRMLREILRKEARGG